jgi:hypothetical protein
MRDAHYEGKLETETGKVMSLGQTSRGHYRSFLGHAGDLRFRLRVEPEDLSAYRGRAQPGDCRGVSLRITSME